MVNLGVSTHILTCFYLFCKPLRGGSLRKIGVFLEFRLQI